MQPLTDIESQQKEASSSFEKKWEAKEMPGWESESGPKTVVNGENAGIWCAACKVLYLTQFHVTNYILGQKHYAKQTVYDAHLSSKKHIKALNKQAISGEPPKNPNGSSVPPPTAGAQSNHQSAAKLRIRNAAYYTHMTMALLVILAPVINETKSNVERRFSLTAREREQELLEQSKPAPPPTAAKEGAAEEEEEEERIYNPLKLPLGWDGKPIPYWLYKLHGLGVEYKCEICSDHVYMGR
jgi:splicing factor 3A subunit 3